MNNYFETESLTAFWVADWWRNLCVTSSINIMKFNRLCAQKLQRPKRPQVLQLNFSILIDIHIKLQFDSVYTSPEAWKECDVIIFRLSRETARVIYDSRATVRRKLTAHNMVSNERAKKVQQNKRSELCKWRHGERYLLADLNRLIALSIGLKSTM